MIQDNFSHIDFSQFRSIVDIVHDLKQPVKVGHLGKRRQGGKEILFISWTRVADYLDYYAPGWMKEVVSRESVAGKLILTIRLYIPAREGMFWKEATGQEEETTDSWGDSSSNSESMAFRRAAANFGLGRYLYEISDDDKAQLLRGNQISVPNPYPKGFEPPEEVKSMREPSETVKEAVKSIQEQREPIQESEEVQEIDPFGEKEPQVPVTNDKAELNPSRELTALLEKARATGFTESQIVTAAKTYHRVSDLSLLTGEQIADLDRRMTANIEKMKDTTPKAETPPKPTRSQLEQLEFLAMKLKKSVVDLAKEYSDGQATVFEDLTGEQAATAIKALDAIDKAKAKGKGK